MRLRMLLVATIALLRAAGAAVLPAAQWRRRH
jgi:hypothetical protein